MAKKKPPDPDAPTAKQSLVLAHLLAGDSVTDAAKKAGVNPATVHRWQKRPAFAEALREGQDGALVAVTNRLKTHVGAAIDRLLAEMERPESPPSTRVQAAKEVLTLSLKFFEQVELREKLDELEAQINEMKGGLR